MIDSTGDYLFHATKYHLFGNNFGKSNISADLTKFWLIQPNDLIQSSKFFSVWCV